MSAADKQTINKIPTNLENGEGSGSIKMTSCTAKGKYNIALGENCEIINLYAAYSRAEEYKNTVSLDYAYAFGVGNNISGVRSHAEGIGNQMTSSYWYTYAFGQDNKVSGSYTHAVGKQNIVSDNYSYGFC